MHAVSVRDNAEHIKAQVQTAIRIYHVPATQNTDARMKTNI